MPEDYLLTYRNLSHFEQGYVDSLLDNESNSDDHAQWVGIGVNDFSPDALRQIVKDCRKFVVRAVGFLNTTDERLFSKIDGYDLGWHFYLERQGTGVGINDMGLGGLGHRLMKAAAPFDWFTVTIGEDRKIHFGSPKLTTDPSV
ncbi:hypothetical protein [Devosia sp. DBB001]|jgi:hypothetical protein|nr:hypothetical protein GHV40_10150 [Devosia sp. D6-9]CDP53015.1 hypothetical protein [Devosia sp. DBB001]